MLARLMIGVLALALLGPARPLSAQEMDRIAAVVNDEAISLQDLDQRTRLAIALSNLPDNMDTRRKVLPQVLRKMVDERIQMQEAGRMKVSISAGEVDNGIGMIEQQNRLPKGALTEMVRRSGVPVSVLRDQIKADITWMRLTTRVIQPTIRIGNEEIEERLDQIKNRHGRPEYLLAEIFLAIEDPKQEDEMRRLGERLIDQLKSGTPFATLARQFSQSPTAANGGSLGWVNETGLDDDLVGTVSKMTPGSVSSPIRVGNGFTIVALVDRRVAGTATNVAESTVTLSQLVFPISPDAPPKPVLMAKAAEMASSAKSCPELEALGRRIHADSVGSMGTMRVSELPQTLRQAVANLPAGRISEPLDTAAGIQVVMVCKREDTTTVQSLPSKDAIRRALEDERMDMLSKRYLRDLRRAAFIDVRI